MNVVVLDYLNKPVWFALKKHINYMLGVRESIILYVLNRTGVELQDIIGEFPESVSVILCKSRLELIFKLISSKDRSIYAATIIEVLFALPAKYLSNKEVYFWVQGILPEEDFLRFKSKFRFKLISILERVSFACCKGFIFVSNEMARHFEIKYNRRFKNSIVVPCISDLSFTQVEKEKNSFVYIGGLFAWQKIDKMLENFNRIFTLLPNAKFYIITFDIHDAEMLVTKYADHKCRKSIVVMTIIDREQIASFLSKMEYGFLLREDIAVNNVSSPIKFAEYLSCGVNPILSSSVTSYADYVNKFDCGMVVEEFTMNDNQILRIPSAQNALILSATYFSYEAQLKKYEGLLN